MPDHVMVDIIPKHTNLFKKPVMFPMIPVCRTWPVPMNLPMEFVPMSTLNAVPPRLAKLVSKTTVILVVVVIVCMI